eukprot:TRINITY_DN266_c0_g1_i9.p1 TRINITY_DN266_c0_g1~~TRINITY_DN266_c0_g1_i9.p1  ORF type:complete len:136 (+),score=30.78 TRINITY_DN266_c0_g1_i9:427-834(+)
MFPPKEVTVKQRGTILGALSLKISRDLPSEIAKVTSNIEELPKVANASQSVPTQVFVKYLDKTITFSIENTEISVQDFKKEVVLKTGIPFEKQILSFAGNIWRRKEETCYFHFKTTTSKREYSLSQSYSRKTTRR